MRWNLLLDSLSLDVALAWSSPAGDSHGHDPRDFIGHDRRRELLLADRGLPATASAVRTLFCAAGWNFVRWRRRRRLVWTRHVPPRE